MKKINDQEIDSIYGKVLEILPKLKVHSYSIKQTAKNVAKIGMPVIIKQKFTSWLVSNHGYPSFLNLGYFHPVFW